jgi:hypothetical protein
MGIYSFFGYVTDSLTLFLFVQTTPGWLSINHVLPGAEAPSEGTVTGAEDARTSTIKAEAGETSTIC